MQFFRPSKYFKIEVVFFLTYFYCFRILTDFEYNFWERHVTGITWQDVEYDLVYGTSGLIAFVVFYRIVRKHLERPRLGRLIVYLIAFLVAYSLYGKLTSYLIAHCTWLTAETRRLATQQYQFKSIGYSVAYMLKEFLAISFLAYFVHSAEQQEKMKALKEQQLLSELSYLKAQLQPHFFFNTLNNIYALALKQSKATAPVVAKLSEMMRYMLYQADQERVLLKDEAAFIKNYVEVEQIRYRDAISIQLDVQGIDGQAAISPLLLLPFIENAFKHGVEEEQEKGFVTIVICQTEDELLMEISNSIAKTQTKPGGIGLANVQKRLKLLYPNRYQLEQQADEKIYQVRLTLQLR